MCFDLQPQPPPFILKKQLFSAGMGVLVESGFCWLILPNTAVFRINVFQRCRFNYILLYK